MKSLPQPACRRGHKGKRGFSLTEVIVAVGIAAGALVAVVGLLGPSLRAVREAGDRAVAGRLVARLTAELGRHGFRQVETATAAGPFEVVASADGGRVVAASQADNDPVGGAPPGLVADERYFHAAIARVVQPVSSGDAGVLVLAIRLSWPYRIPGAAEPVPEAAREWTVSVTAVAP